MNWLQKIASISFWLDGSQKISQPKDVMALSYDLQKFVHVQTGKMMDIHTIQPDGDMSDLTGTINWYVTKFISEEEQLKVMQEWIAEQQMMDYQIKVRGPERSGMNDWNPDENNPEMMVYRLDVIKNGSADHMEIPEMNISNTNAQAVMDALGVQFDWSGSVDLNEMKTKLEMFTPYQQQELIQAPEYSGEEGKVQMYDAGRDEDRVERYIGGFRQIVDFGLQNGFEVLVWG